VSDHTFGFEFEVTRLQVRSATAALVAAGIDATAPGYTHAVSEQWKVVPDGSVQNGCEVVSPILTADRINTATPVCKALKAAGASVSTATGFHVHIGAGALTTPDALARLVRSWYGVHHATGALVAPSRINNRFAAVLNQRAAEATAESSYRPGRYVSLNLESMERHGTVEFRLHQGTLNPAKAIAWAQYCDAFVKIANAGIDLSVYTDEGLQHLTRWSHQYRNAEQAGLLLDWMVAGQWLAPNAGGYLKTRSAALQ